MGNFPAAWEATERAETYFDLASPFPPAARSATTLGLIQGKILHFLGRTDEGLLRIEQSANLILNVFEEPAKYVEAMTIYNTILMHAGRLAEAAERWQEIGALAREKGDKATLAYVLNNIGRCYLQMGRTNLAQPCFLTALEIFEQLGLDIELPDVRLNLAFALRESGRYSEAILEIYRCRAEFAKLGMKVAAGAACVRLLETSLMAGRHDDLTKICEDTVTFFQDAGLPEQANRAAQFLLVNARKGALEIAAVRQVCHFLIRLQDSPGEAFSIAM